MRRYLSHFFLAAILGSASLAHADFLLEPYLGYMAGHWKQGSSTSQNGIDLGLRTGWQNLGLQLGVNYMTGSWSDKSTPNTYSITPSDFGLFVGYDFPVFIRVFAEYDFLSNPKFSRVGNSMTLDGHAGKIGVGFTPFPFLKINFEYYTASYNRNKSTNAGITPNIDMTMYGVSVSAPLTF